MMNFSAKHQVDRRNAKEPQRIDGVGGPEIHRGSQDGRAKTRNGVSRHRTPQRLHRGTDSLMVTSESNHEKL